MSLARNIAIAALAVTLTGGSVLATPSVVDRIRSSIASSDILPSDYREHFNVVVDDSVVSVSVYRDPDALPNDCRIDAILLADKVLEADSSVRKVRVAFYDLSEADKYWEAEVPASAVSEYARGTIDRDGVLRAVPITPRQANNLAKQYGTLSYKEMIERLGIIDGPLKEERLIALIRIDKLRSQGADVDSLRSKFLHVEDLARRGRQSQVASALKDLTAEIRNAGTKDNRLSHLQELREEIPRMAPEAGN